MGLCLLAVVFASCSPHIQRTPDAADPDRVSKPEAVPFAGVGGRPACGALFFLRYSGDKSAVFRLDAGEVRAQPLTSFSRSGPTELAASPDAARIAYTSGAFQQTLTVLSSDGTESTIILRGGGSYSFPSWRPGSDELMIVRAQSTYLGQVTVLDDDGGVEIVAEGWAPSWSPDGTRIALVVPRSRESEIGRVEMIDPEEPDSTPTVLSQRALGPLAWAPDGSLLAFRKKTRGSQYNEVFVASTSGERNAHRVTRDGTRFSGAVDGQWSPDGTRFTYASISDVAMRVHDMATRDGFPRTSTAAPVGKLDSRTARWSPRGHLAFVERGGILIVRPGGHTDRIRRPPGSSDDQPVWAPC